MLIARGKVPPGIAEAVSEGRRRGRRSYEAPEGRELVGHLVNGAGERGFELSPDAAALLISHLGDSLTRLDNELDRLALWAGPEGTVELEDLEEMVSDSSEVKGFALGDAVVAGDRRFGRWRSPSGWSPRARARPERSTRPRRRCRRVHKAIALLDSGAPPNRIGSELKLPPFIVRQVMEAARQFIARLDPGRDDRDGRPRTVDPWRRGVPRGAGPRPGSDRGHR